MTGVSSGSRSDGRDGSGNRGDRRGTAVAVEVTGGDGSGNRGDRRGQQWQ